MTHVTAVDAYWLGELLYYYPEHPLSHGLIAPPTADYGSVFYSVTEKKFDERGNCRIADRECSKRAELEIEMAKQRGE